MNKTDKFKASRYNFYYKFSDDRNIAFNSLATSAIMLNDETCNILNALGDTDVIDGWIIDPEILETLLNGRFLLNVDEDEISVLKSRYESISAEQTLSLSLIVTRSCNFDCPYCCLQKDTRCMSSGTWEKIKEAIYNALKRFKTVSIAYFGGEPLLKLDLVENISLSISEICKEHNAFFSQSIVTNGYLLDKNTRAKLSGLGIDSIQITLDGPKAVHDKQRLLKGGGATFDVILENIQACVDEGFYCTLKSLYDMAGYSHQYELIDLLVHRNIHGKLKYCPQIIKPQHWESSSYSLCTLPSTSREESIARLKVLNYAHKNNLEVTPFTLKNRYCSAEYPHVYFVDVDGYLYKCGFSLDRQFSAGHISNIDFSPRNESISVFSSDPFGDSICRTCRLIPLCMGGCKYLKNKLGKRNCISARYFFKHYLYLFLSAVVGNMHGCMGHEPHINNAVGQKGGEFYGGESKGRI